MVLGIKKIWLNLRWLLKEWFSKLDTWSIFSRVLLPKSKNMPGVNLGHLEGVFLRCISFYLSKEKLFEGKPSGSPIKNSFFSAKFNFIADKQGEYTLKITPYNYGIAFIDVSVHDIAR